MTDRTLTLIQDDGTEIVCDILFTYSYEKTNKNYVVFQVRNTEEVSAATYEPTENGEGKLGKIETEEEWAMLEDLLSDYAANLEEADSCSGNCSSCGGSCSCEGEDCDCGCDE